MVRFVSGIMIGSILAAVFFISQEPDVPLEVPSDNVIYSYRNVVPHIYDYQPGAAPSRTWLPRCDSVTFGATVTDEEIPRKVLVLSLFPNTQAWAEEAQKQKEEKSDTTKTGE